MVRNIHGNMFASAKGKQQKKVRQLQCQEQCIDYIPYYLSVLSRTHFSDNLSRNSCILLIGKGCGGGRGGRRIFYPITKRRNAKPLFSQGRGEGAASHRLRNARRK